MTQELMAPLMFGALVVLLLLGYPVAFSLAANGVLFALIGIHMELLRPELLQALPERIFGIMRNETLLAIPFFTFMGLVLERSGMAEELLDTIGQLFGTLRGGLAYAVVLVGALLAATTGVVAASVISMGLISLPIMMRYGYSHRLASGVIAASGTLAQIIPPSLVLIVLADQLGRSVGDMYRGAMIPGLTLAALYMAYVAVMSVARPNDVPALPPEVRAYRGLALLRRTLVALMPPLVLIFLVLGTIFIGVATPTEGGAMGATGALALALVRRRLTLPLLRQAMQSTATLTSFVVFIVVGSSVLRLHVFARSTATFLGGAPCSGPCRAGPSGFLVAVTLPHFRLLAFLLDFFEITFILVRCSRRWRKSSASISCGSASCWQSTCRRPSCIRRSGSLLLYRACVTKQIRTSRYLLGRRPFVRSAGHGRASSPGFRRWFLHLQERRTPRRAERADRDARARGAATAPASSDRARATAGQRAQCGAM